MNTEEDKLLVLAGWMIRSKNRYNVMVALGNKAKTPTVLSKNTNIKINRVSDVLKELKLKGLVVCLNEEAKKGRLFQQTDLGKKIMRKTHLINDE